MIENFNPEYLFLRDEICRNSIISTEASGERYVDNIPYEVWDTDPFLAFDIKKIALIDDIILGKEDSSKLDFDNNRFLAECLVNESLAKNHKYFTPTKDGLIKLINYWCESGDGCPWIGMPTIFYKHLTLENFIKQYVGLCQNEKMQWNPDENHLKKEALCNEYPAQSKSAEINFKKLFNYFEYCFHDSSVKQAVEIIDEIVCLAEKLKIKINPIFSDPTCDYFRIEKEQFNQVIENNFEQWGKEKTERMVNNYRKIFKNFYPQTFYQQFLKDSA